MKSEIIDKSLALVDRSFTGVLGTVDENGFPQAKAMIKTAANGLKEFWFCSNTSSKRAGKYRETPMLACILRREDLRGSAAD